MITRLFVAEGAYIEKGADLIEFETSKTAIVLESPVSGYVQFLYAEESEVEVNSVVCVIESAPSKRNSEEVVLNSDISTENRSNDSVIFSKKVSQASYYDLNIEGKWWITSKMLTKDRGKSSAIAKGVEIQNASLDEGALKPVAGNQNLTEGGYDLVKTSMRKRAEVNSLGVSGGGAFQSTIGIDIISGKRIVPSIMFNNSIQDLLCYESSKMLRDEFRDLNGFYISANKIGLYCDVCAGISLDTLNKLTVARIENSDKKSLQELQELIGSIIVRFEDGALSNDDLKASTFTITDLSTSGASYVRPLLNGSESLIIGVVRRSEICFGLYVSFDHRVTEGLRVANFLDGLKQRVESHFSKLSIGSALKCDFCMESLEEQINLGSRGMLLMSTISGQKSICRNCYEGW
jgi:pyruvate/2-oxoglutarate dehydrogenase complex dihydrolipoamide acyltransferase (E2) component